MESFETKLGEIGARYCVISFPSALRLLRQFKLFGPSRRCEQTAIELWLQLTAEEAALMETTAGDAQRGVLARLESLRLSLDDDHPIHKPLSGPGALQYAALLGRIALALQQHAGHRVAFEASYAARQPAVAGLVVEYEHGDAGLESIRLAIRLLEEEIPGILLGGREDQATGSFRESWRSYLEAAPGQLLPRQAQDIIDAARRLDIPVVKLDRDPYQGLRGDFRLCPNGMLKLGHGCRQRVIDGTFPVDSGESLAALAHDRRVRRQALESLGAPLPAAGGFSATGRTYCAILANGALVAVLELDGGRVVADMSLDVPEKTRIWLAGLARKLGAPMMTISWVTTDITRPLPRSGTVLDMDVAPILDGLLPGNAPVAAERIRSRAAEGLLNHLFPPPTQARIPIVSVTGTNGKSTVCAMIAKIAQRAGYRVGRAGTTGLYIEEALRKAGDFAGGKGHHLVLESAAVDFAVLETARGAATGFGLMFDRCDVAVCTNVSADHLGERGIDTVEQMAELKRWIVERARDSVVLNADNTYSANMLAHLPGRKAWLVSETMSAKELRPRFGGAVGLCNAEPTERGEWISLHDGGQSTPVVAVADIPATLGGVARFNVSNALQAIATAYQMGIPVQVIREALADFTTDFEHLPGRLNFYHGLPFKVLFDFAHNDEGHRALRSVVDEIEVEGRKVLLFRRRGNTSDKELLGLTRVVAGGYDRFVCCDHNKLMGRQPGEVPALLRKGLVQNGVDGASVVVAGREEAVDVALRMCRPGDLLVATTTSEALYSEWSQITRFQ